MNERAKRLPTSDPKDKVKLPDVFIVTIGDIRAANQRKLDSHIGHRSGEY